MIQYFRIDQVSGLAAVRKIYRSLERKFTQQLHTFIGMGHRARGEFKSILYEQSFFCKSYPFPSQFLIAFLSQIKKENLLKKYIGTVLPLGVYVWLTLYTLHKRVLLLKRVDLMARQLR